MTYTQLVTSIMSRLGLESDEAEARIGEAVNRHNRLISASLNLTATRMADVVQTTTPDSAEVTFDGVEKLLNLYHYVGGSRVDMTEVTRAALRAFGDPEVGTPTHYAITYTSANSVTVTLNAVADDAYDLFADAVVTLTDLSGAGYPVLAESFHDAIAEAVLADEYIKQEKKALAERAERRSEKILSDLRLFMAKSSTKVQRQGDLASGRPLGGGGGGSAQSASTTTFLQSGTGAVQRTVTSRLRETVSVKDFGAAGDGTTDDVDAFEAALTYAAAAAADGTTRAVYVPGGIYMVSDQVIVPNKVLLVGENKRATIIRATTDFPVSTPIVQLGDGSDDLVFDCRVESLTVDCNDVAGSTGIYTTQANEGCGGKYVAVRKYKSYGILIEDGTTAIPDHFRFEDVEVSCSAAAASTTGLRYYGTRNGGQLHRFTVDTPAGASSQLYGVHVEGVSSGCQLQVVGLNVEEHTEALRFDTDAGGTAMGVTLLAGGTTLVHIIGSKPVTLLALYRATGTNTIVNDVLGTSHTADRIEWYVTSDSASDGGYQAFTSAGGTPDYGHVMGVSQPMWRIWSAATSGGDRRCLLEFRDGNGTGWRMRSAPEGTNAPLELFPITAGVVGSAMLTLRNDGTVLPATDGAQAIGSGTLRWRVHHEVVATASLPAAGATQDGRVILEDAGAGDRNVIIYAGGQRFRIDGGANF